MVRVVYFLVMYFRVFTNCLNFLLGGFLQKIRIRGDSTVFPLVPCNFHQQFLIMRLSGSSCVFSSSHPMVRVVYFRVVYFRVVY